MTRGGSTRRWRELRAHFQQLINTSYIECRRCHKQIRPGDDWHLGHVVPVMDGGRDTLDNVSPECAGCNLRGRAHDIHGDGREPDHPPTFPW